MREIRTLRARWRELETGLRRLLGGHERGNPGYRQGGSSGLPRQFSTLPGFGLVASISESTIWRWLDQDAIRPWQHRCWIFPRDPHFAFKAGRLLDLYERL